MVIFQTLIEALRRCSDRAECQDIQNVSKRNSAVHQSNDRPKNNLTDSSQRDNLVPEHPESGFTELTC